MTENKFTCDIAYLRRLINLTWNAATESEQCPSRQIENRLISAASIEIVGSVAAPTVRWHKHAPIGDANEGTPDV